MLISYQVNEKEAEEKKREAATLGLGDDNELNLESNEGEVDERFSFVLSKDRMVCGTCPIWLLI